MNARYTVRPVRPMDLSEGEKATLVAKGYKLPLSARIGRGPMFIVSKATS